MSYGDVCWAGYYCPNGTDYPDPCPPGTFLETEGLGDESDCVPCSPGMFLRVELGKECICDPLQQNHFFFFIN